MMVWRPGFAEDASDGTRRRVRPDDEVLPDEVALIALYVLAAFIGAALLFTLELMFSRMVLPLLGGTASVWTTCLLFYQFVLLAGYAYSHMLPGALGLRRHAILHVALLLLSLLL